MLKRFWPIVLLIFLSFLVKIIRIEDPPKFYFDEVYHAFTANEEAKGNRSVYDPWAKPPPGVAYEWTHPPLGKLMMSGFIRAFGNEPFAWRINSVLCGILLLILMAVFAQTLFKNIWITGMSVFLMSIDGLSFVTSRIGMIDAPLSLFLTLTAYFYWRFRAEPEKIIWSALLSFGVGISVATKWTGIYLFPILFLCEALFVWEAKKFRPFKTYAISVGFLALFPACIYFLSYAEFFSMGYDLKQFKELQRQMWYYHTGLKATHDYKSVPLQWVFDLRPVWMYTSRGDSGYSTNIYNLGNPFILWAGFLSAIHLALEMGKKLFKKSGFLSDSGLIVLLVFYFFFWAPWAFSPRIMFFYHYVPAIPFLCMILAKSLWEYKISANKLSRQGFWGFLVLALLWFLVFYPHLTALPVPTEFADKAYYWFPGWR